MGTSETVKAVDPVIIQDDRFGERKFKIDKYVKEYSFLCPGCSTKRSGKDIKANLRAHMKECQPGDGRRNKSTTENRVYFSESSV